MLALPRAVVGHWKQLPYRTLDRNTSIPQVCHLAKFLLTIINNKLGNEWYFGLVCRFDTESCKWNMGERTRRAIAKGHVKGSEVKMNIIITKHITQKKAWIEMRRRTNPLQPLHPTVRKLSGPQGCLDIMVKKETTAFIRIQALFILCYHFYWAILNQPVLLGLSILPTQQGTKT
jgi:hypothetical protein